MYLMYLFLSLLTNDTLVFSSHRKEFVTKEKHC